MTGTLHSQEYEASSALVGMHASAPLILLHAYPLDHRLWDDVAGVLLRHPTRAERIVAIDLPGMGKSAVPEGEPSVEMSAELVAATLDGLGIDHAIVAGVSMGGYVALAFADLFAARVAGLALLDTKASADTSAARANRLAIAERVLAEGSVDSLLGETEILLGASTRAAGPDVPNRVASIIRAQTPAGVAWSQRAMAARPDRLAVLRALDVPTSIVVGAEDTLAPLSEAKLMVEAARHPAFEVIAVAGHLSPIEAPRQTAAALRVLCLRAGDRR